MGQTSNRSRRVSEQVRRELALLIQHELKDPRLGMITVASVEVSRDFAHAKVFVTVLGDDAEQTALSITGLRHAAGFLRRELGRCLQLRVLPELHFTYDDSVANGAHISALIDRAIAADAKNTEAK